MFCHLIICLDNKNQISYVHSGYIKISNDSANKYYVNMMVGFNKQAKYSTQVNEKCQWFDTMNTMY